MYNSLIRILPIIHFILNRFVSNEAVMRYFLKYS